MAVISPLERVMSSHSNPVESPVISGSAMTQGNMKTIKFSNVIKICYEQSESVVYLYKLCKEGALLGAAGLRWWN